MRAAVVIAGIVAMAACGGDIETGPKVATSLEFQALPFPAIVAGDTLRDINGVAARLRATAFNSDNDEIVDAPIRYGSLASFLSVDSTSGIVVAGAAPDSSARVVASIGRLQSAPLRLSIVPRPDTLARFGAIDTLRYSVSDTTRNVSGDLAVRVAHRSSTGDSPVRDWIVTFALQNPGDSTRARIVADDGRQSVVDTTSVTGVAARRIRLLPAGLTSARDSIVLLARARYRGADLRGSPVRLILPVQPVAP